MSDLIVIGYPDEHRAYDVWAELVKLGHDYLVDLEDAAIIWRDENGKVHVTTPAHHAVAKGTVSGLFWGTLIGLLFMFPLAPLAGVAGGIMGAALGAAWRLGIKDDFRQRVQDLVQPGTSALMVIVRKTTPEKFTEALRPYGGTVLKTSLPRDAGSAVLGSSVSPSAAISARPWAAIAAAQAAPVSSANCSSSPVQVRMWPA